MLKRRIIPFLTIDKSADCVKTINFSERNYIGDIFNNIRIFNEKNVDELVLLDIDASKEKKEPNFEILEKIASVCRMPVTYGGGVQSLKVAKKIIGFGIEKICLNSIALNNLNIIRELSDDIGSQSLSICINIQKTKDDYEIVFNNKEKVAKNLIDYLKNIQKAGVGEIIFNSVDNDGAMKGYDNIFLDKYLDYVNVPSVMLGGCSSYDDIRSLFKKFKNIAAGCSSVFIYKGKFRAVLINYPSESEKIELNI